MGVFYETSVRDMCDFGSTFHGSLMYLWNKNFPHFSNDVDCGCTVTVDTELELNIKVQCQRHMFLILKALIIETDNVKYII